MNTINTEKQTNEHRLVSDVVNYKTNVSDAMARIVEEYGVSSTFDYESSTMTLSLPNGLNESISNRINLINARDYVYSRIGEDKITVVIQ